MILETFCIILLCSGLVYAIWDARNGDKHPNHDLFFISIISAVTCIIVALINPKHGFPQDITRAAVLSFAIFVSVFPYAINIFMHLGGVIDNKRWWDHLSPTAVPDKWKVWKNSHWGLRMAFLFLVLCFAAYFYAN